MTYLLILCLFLLPYGIGDGMLCMLYRGRDRQNLSKADALLAGWLAVIGLAEMAHLTALVLGRPFSDCRKYFLALLLAALMLAGGMTLWNRRKYGGSGGSSNRDRSGRGGGRTFGRADIPGALFGIVVVVQVVLLVMERRMYLVGDQTVETVNTILTTDALYTVNPLTGFPFAEGMPLRLKILCLPTLYAILCKWTGLAAAQVVWVVIPVVTLLGSYIAYSAVARALFAEQRDRLLFLLLVALLLQVGGYLYGMDGFGLQFAGWQGVSIRGGILLPWLFATLLRRRYKLAVLCILAEACMVWTLYGMGMCLLATVLFLAVDFARRRIGSRNGGSGI